MLQSYNDIRSLIDREPDWFDENGVPRYAPFSPDMQGVYDKYCALVEIRCQACHLSMNVGVGVPDWGHANGEIIRYTLEMLVNKDEQGRLRFHFGDPPSHGCVGDTMNCEDIRVIEAWRRNDDYTAMGENGWQAWIRVPECEGEIYARYIEPVVE